jgi:hypothetical protein
LLFSGRKGIGEVLERLNEIFFSQIRAISNYLFCWLFGHEKPVPMSLIHLSPFLLYRAALFHLVVIEDMSLGDNTETFITWIAV